MTLRLLKLVNDHIFFEENKFSKRYDVFEGNELAGQFFYSKKKCFFTFEKKRMELDIRKPFFASPKVSIVEGKTGETIGKYNLTNWVIFAGYTDSIFINHDIFEFKRLSPDIKHSIFKRDTWGHFKFSLSNHVEEIIYSFRIVYPTISLGNIAPDTPFEGTVDFSGSNKLLLLAGLYLVERALDNESEA